MTKYHVKCHSTPCQDKVTVSDNYKKFVDSFKAKFEQLTGDTIKTDQVWRDVTRTLFAYFETESKHKQGCWPATPYPRIARSVRRTGSIKIALFSKETCYTSNSGDFPLAFSLEQFEKLVQNLLQYFPEPLPAASWRNAWNWFSSAPGPVPTALAEDESIPLLIAVTVVDDALGGAIDAPPHQDEVEHAQAAAAPAAQKPPFPFLQTEFTAYSRLGALGAWGRRTYWSNRMVLAMFIMLVISAGLNGYLSLEYKSGSGGASGNASNCTPIDYYNANRTGTLPGFPDPQDCNDLRSFANWLVSMLREFGVRTFADLNSLLMTPTYSGNATIVSQGIAEYLSCPRLPAPIHRALTQAVYNASGTNVQDVVNTIFG